jgi:5-methyltetrahydrofolate--homocysteine methyltransferase
MSEILEQLKKDLYDGNVAQVKEVTEKALAEGIAPGEILKNGLIAGMDRVGVDFKEGTLYIPEVLIAAKSMHAGMDVLKPLLSEADVPSMGVVVIGTVTGDMHDIGKNLVGMMLEGAGFEIIDLGTDTSPEAFVEAVRSEGADIVGLSALLTTTMPGMRNTIDALAEANLLDKVIVMVGGAPVTEEFAKQVEADGYAPDAATAVDKAKELLARS